jgi:hypothetical protein
VFTGKFDFTIDFSFGATKSNLSLFFFFFFSKMKSKKTQKEVKVQKKVARKRDFEIESESEDDAKSIQSQNSDLSEDLDETPAQKRLRLAKEYLTTIKDENDILPQRDMKHDLSVDIKLVKRIPTKQTVNSIVLRSKIYFVTNEGLVIHNQKNVEFKEKLRNLKTMAVSFDEKYLVSAFCKCNKSISKLGFDLSRAFLCTCRQSNALEQLGLLSLLLIIAAIEFESEHSQYLLH